MVSLFVALLPAAATKISPFDWAYWMADSITVEGAVSPQLLFDIMRRGRRRNGWPRRRRCRCRTRWLR